MNFCLPDPLAPPKLCPGFVPDALVGYSNGQALEQSIGATPSQAQPGRSAMVGPWSGHVSDGLELETPGNTWKHLETPGNHQKHHQTSPHITALGVMNIMTHGKCECLEPWENILKHLAQAVKFENVSLSVTDFCCEVVCVDSVDCEHM